MSLLTYVQDPSHGFTQAEQRALQRWYDELAAVNAWKIIRRNADRDCARQDIDHTVYRDYLRQLAWCYRPHQPNPTEFMDGAFGQRRSHYLLPGQRLIARETDLVRYMRLDHLVKYNLQAAGIPVSYNMNEAIVALQNRTLGGNALVGSTLGRPEHPVWVAPSGAIAVGASADDTRDQLGMKHIEFGHLVELKYPQTAIQACGVRLKAPTILDAVAGGAENWVFVKRTGSGGPEWGHAVDLASCCARVQEAVHAPLLVTLSFGSQVELRYVGAIRNSPPQVDYQTLYDNT